MTFPDAVKNGFSNYVTFSGRASRSEYWWWFLFVLIVAFVTGLLDSMIFGTPVSAESGGPLSAILTLALFLPNLAVFVRRLHDRDKSAWWILLLFVPLIGFLVILVWMLMPGTDGANRFGVEPE